MKEKHLFNLKNNSIDFDKQTNQDKDKNCTECCKKNKSIDTQKQKILFYKKKSIELTNQLLQTEDQWVIEVEKQNQKSMLNVLKIMFSYWT